MSEFEVKIRKLPPEEAEKIFPPDQSKLRLIKGYSSRPKPQTVIRQLFHEPDIPRLSLAIGEGYEPRFVTVTNSYTKSETYLVQNWEQDHGRRKAIGCSLVTRATTYFSIIHRDLDLLTLEVAAARGTSNPDDIAQIRSILLEVWQKQNAIQED